MSIFAREPAGASVAEKSSLGMGEKSSSWPLSKIASNTFLIITEHSVQKNLAIFSARNKDRPATELQAVAEVLPGLRRHR
jgi:hypothetical protein